MKEQFHNSSIISTEQINRLYQKSDQPAFLRFTIMYLVFILMNFLVVHSWENSWLYCIIAQLGYAILSCSLFAALHETAHRTAFKTKTFNKIGALLAGFGHLYPPSLFRALHFTHHRYTHIPGKDPEISLGNRPAPAFLSNPGLYLSWLSGIPLLFFKLMMLVSGALFMPTILRKHLYPFVRPTQRRKIFLQSLSFLIVYMFVIYATFFIDARFMGIIIGQILGHCLLAFYVSMEHNGLSHEGNIFDKTRSIKAPKFVKTIMWNMPYHAEHHAFPAVPFHALPDLHKTIQPEIKHQDQNHFDFHLDNFSKLINPKQKS